MHIVFHYYYHYTSDFDHHFYYRIKNMDYNNVLCVMRIVVSIT